LDIEGPSNYQRATVFKRRAGILAALSELLSLAFLPEECGSSFLEPSCPPGLKALREAAWGLYFRLGAAISLTLAAVGMLRIPPHRAGPRREG
jgi:hypothetical protein